MPYNLKVLKAFKKIRGLNHKDKNEFILNLLELFYKETHKPKRKKIAYVS